MSTEHQPVFAAADYAAPAEVERLRKAALGVGVGGSVACLLGLLLSPQYFFRAYLFGWLGWVGVALGCFAVMMLHHMSRGAWGLVVRRVLEAASRTLPWMLLLALPLFVFGLDDLFLWARPEEVAKDHLLQAKQAYLNPTAFFVRLVIYFALWGGFAWALNRWSKEQDTEPRPELTRRMQLVSALGLAGWCLAVTWASVDWLMSLDPHWFSTIYGVWFMARNGLSALAFLIAVGIWLAGRPPMSGVIAARHLHDWGKLFFAFVMLWAYFTFSQFLIIWSGNLPEEIEWHLKRISHGWGPVALLIVVLHFVVPFMLLLSRDLKRNPRLLLGVALLLLGMGFVDLFWQMEPGFAEHSAAYLWLYPAGLAGAGGLWLFLFLGELKKRPLLPLGDPYLAEAIGEGDEHS